MRKTIFVFYEHTDREYQACAALAKVLTDEYDYNAIVMSIHFEISKALAIWMKNPVEAIIIPFAYSDNLIDTLSPMFRRPKMPWVFSLDNEQIGSEFSEPVLYPIDVFSKERVVHFAWADGYKDMLASHGVKESNVYIVGNLRVALTMENSISSNRRVEFADKYNLDLRKKWILFAENRLSDYTQDSLTWGLPAGISTEQVELHNIECKNSLNAMMKDINALDDEFFDKYEVIYRAHPGQFITTEVDKRVRCISENSIYNWYTAIDYLISFNSTSLFEADALQIPVLRYDAQNTNKKYIIKGLEEYMRIYSFADIDGITQDQYEEQAKKQIYLTYLGSIKCNAVIKISNIVDLVIKGELTPYDRNSNLTRIKKKTYRIVISNIIMRALYALFGAKGLKLFPSYSLIRDLPKQWKSILKKPLNQ